MSLARYVFNYSLAWSDELAGLGFVWLTLLGSVAACRRRTHMAMGFFPKWFGPAGQRRIGLYVNAGILFFLAAMVVEGIRLSPPSETSPRSCASRWAFPISACRWRPC